MSEQYDAGDVKSVAKRKTKYQLARERMNEELRQIVDTPGGAYLIWRILCESGIYTGAPDNDAQSITLHEGKRRVGQWLLAELVGVDESLYTQVRKIGSIRDNGDE